MAQTVKSLPSVWETQIWSLGREYLLENEMATHCSILAWKIPWMEEPGRRHTMGLQRVGHNWATSLSPFIQIHKIVKEKNQTYNFNNCTVNEFLMSEAFSFLSRWRFRQWQVSAFPREEYSSCYGCLEEGSKHKIPLGVWHHPTCLFF